MSAIALPCPDCGSSSVVAITYGEPTAPPANDERIGGCVLAVDSPRWACRTCDHRWGTFAGYDFENLATRLELAVETTMWSRVTHYQWEALDVARGLLAAPRLSFFDDDAENARRLVVEVLGATVTEAAIDALTDQERDNLAEALLCLLRYAERKAANG